MDKVIFSIEKDEPGIVCAEVLDTVNGVRKATRQRMALEEFIRVLQASKETSNRVRVGRLPNGFYDGYLDVDGKGFQCLIILPEGIKPFVYYDKTYFIPFPKLVFSITARDGRLKKSSVFALSNEMSEKVSSNTTLCNYPFGNVYDHGGICWGSNDLKGLTELRSAEQVISSFFGCSTNDDLWSNGKNIIVPKDDQRILQRGLVESLVGTEKFPDEIMVKRCNPIADLMK